MTENMVVSEELSGIIGPDLMTTLHVVRYIETNGRVDIECVNGQDTTLNFDGGATSQYVACNVMAEVDHQNAREQNMNLKVEGTTAIERLRNISSKITSGKLHLDVRQSKLDPNFLNEL